MDGLLPVECGICGWKGKRKPGNLVFCPQCGACAGFQPSPREITDGRASQDT